MMAPSSTKQWAVVPLLRNLGTAVTVVLAVIATMLLTELLLCISLSAGPVIVVVRGVVAFGASTVRRVSAFAQVSKQVAVDMDCYLAEMLSQRKRVAAAACVATTTVLAVCTRVIPR